MIQQSQIPSPDTQLVSCRSKVESTRSVVSWEIEKFSLLCPRVGGLEYDTFDIRSPLQESILRNCGENGTSDLRLNWQVQLRTNNSQNDAKNFLSICFYTCDNPIPEMRMSLTISVIGAANCSVLSGTTNFNNSVLKAKDGRATGFGFPTFIKLEDVWKEGSEYLTNDDSLHLKIDITFSARSPPPNATADNKLKSNSSTATVRLSQQLQLQLKNDLIEDMERLLESGNNSDLAINCSGKVFKVHSFVLKARSPVFRAMLEAGMNESLNSEIKIDDVDPAHFEAFLEYLYKGSLPTAILENLDVRIGLVRVADKYQVLKLRDFCFGQLAEHMSLERAGEILVLMSLHSAPEEIRAQSLGFCLKNWRVLSNDATFKEILTTYPNAFLNVQSSLGLIFFFDFEIGLTSTNPDAGLLHTIPNSVQEHSPKAVETATSPAENSRGVWGRCVII